MSMNQTDAAYVAAHLSRMAEPGLGNELRESLLRVVTHLNAQIARMNQPLFNPSAFPVDYVPGVMNGEPGMSLRDYFAAHAPTPQLPMDLEDHSAYRYRYADAMLKERHK